MTEPQVAEVLEVWQEGERLLTKLAPLSPDHETVRLAVNDLRSTYIKLVDRGHGASYKVEATARTIEKAERAIREAAHRTGHRYPSIESD